MRKKGFIIALAITLLTVFSVTTISYGSTTLSTPKVKANSVNREYIKVSWGKVSGATKYSVYRATSKSGTYKRIITTKNKYYNDKDVKNDQGYYYKVKAFGTKGKTSRYSQIRSSRVRFIGKLYLSAYNFVMGFGDVKRVYITASGCNDVLIADYDSDWIDIKWVNQYKKGSYALDIYVIKQTSEPVSTSIDLAFKDHKRFYKKTINFTISPESADFVY